MKKSIKTMTVLVALMVIAAFTAGCVSKATGGGWFISEDTSMNPGHKANFGFNLNISWQSQDPKDWKGEMQFKDHETGFKFHIKDINFWAIETQDPAPNAYFGGIDNKGKQVYVYVEDNGEPGIGPQGDYIEIWYDFSYIPIAGVDQPTWSGHISGGNIQTFEDKT